MANLKDLRRLCLGQYGNLAGRFGDEDAEFPMALLADWLNDEHRQLARATWLYRETQTYNLPVASGGVSTVNLDCNIIVIVPDQVRALIGGVWRLLYPTEEDRELHASGPFEEWDSSEPTRYFLRTGAALDAHRQMVILPGATTAVTNGVKVDAYIYPALMTAETHAPAMQPAEQSALIYRVNKRMAESQLAKGVQSAGGLASYFGAEAARQEAELKEVLGLSRRTGPRRIRATYDRAW